MKLLFRWALLWLVVLALLIWGSILVGHTGTRPKFFDLLDTCSGTPCYNGMTPGVSLWMDVESRLENAPELNYDLNYRTSATPPGFTGKMSFYPSAVDGSLSEVDLFFQPTILNIGDIVLEIGTPCAVAVTSDIFALVYPGMAVFVDREKLGVDQSLNPMSAVRSMNILPRRTCEPLTTPPLHPWRGFGRYVS
jgi:hypothetical protein